MAIDFGSGPKLKEILPWLYDDEVRHKLILEVVERNSVIAGLPPFDRDIRLQFKEHLADLAATPKAAGE